MDGVVEDGGWEGGGETVVWGMSECDVERGEWVGGILGYWD